MTTQQEMACHLRRCLTEYGASWADYDSWGRVMAIHEAPHYDAAELIARIAARPRTFVRGVRAYAAADHDVTADGPHPTSGLLIDIGPPGGDDHDRMIQLEDLPR